MLSTMIYSGCRPMQPYYLREDGDLSHYLDKATEIDYPDVEECSLAEVTQAQDPVTVRSIDPNAPKWDLTLEEAIQTSLQNSKVIRTFGQIRQFGQFINQPAERLSIAPDASLSIYDVAIQESGQGGVEQILSNFDAVFNSRTTWERFDRPQNVFSGNAQFTPPVLGQDVVTMTNELSKLSASGAQFFIRNNSTYTAANNARTVATRAVPTDWLTNIEAEIRQPLARNRGAQVNRIPVVLARIRADVTSTIFETSVMNLVQEVERAYWDLYFFYHNLEAATIGRNSALSIWRRIYAKYETGAPGGEAEQEAQAREQYYLFRSRVEGELNNVLRQESRLRFLMGLAASDGRIIRPIDSPTTAQLTFDWQIISREALMRNPSLRQQRWRIKQRELELIAARNQLLPRIDAVALYRPVGAGINFNPSNPTQPIDPRTGQPVLFPASAWGELFSGQFQEFRLGLEAEIPIGFRQPLAQVRNQQLQLTREKARLEDTELEVMHQLDDAIKDMDAQYQLLQSNLGRVAAAYRQVEAVEAAFDAGTVVLDLLLDAQRRRSDAETAYFQSLTQYNEAIMSVHLRKGTILEYNNIVMAEGPWPAKAYFDAQNLARQRDASHCLHYGYSRPDVISRGPLENNVPPMSPPVIKSADPYDSAGTDQELVPTPATEGTAPKGGQRPAVREGTESELPMPALPKPGTTEKPSFELDQQIEPAPAIEAQPEGEDENILETYRSRRLSQRKSPAAFGNVVRFTDARTSGTTLAEPIPVDIETGSRSSVSVRQTDTLEAYPTHDEAAIPPMPIQVRFK